MKRNKNKFEISDIFDDKYLESMQKITDLQIKLNERRICEIERHFIDESGNILTDNDPYEIIINKTEIKCSYCGSIVESATENCHNCGAPIE